MIEGLALSSIPTRDHLGLVFWMASILVEVSHDYSILPVLTQFEPRHSYPPFLDARSVDCYLCCSHAVMSVLVSVDSVLDLLFFQSYVVSVDLLA
jgi:hypothetical protein